MAVACRSLLLGRPENFSETSVVLRRATLPACLNTEAVCKRLMTLCVPRFPAAVGWHLGTWEVVGLLVVAVIAGLLSLSVKQRRCPAWPETTLPWELRQHRAGADA